MQEYAFEVKLVAVVRVRATEEVVARKVVPSVLGSPGTVEISLANESNTMLGLNATVTEVDFSAEGTSAVLLDINGKKSSGDGVDIADGRIEIGTNSERTACLPVKTTAFQLGLPRLSCRGMPHNCFGNGASHTVDDIANVHPDMGADVHLIAYKQRITPVVRGKVMQVSADRLTEKRTDNPYYVALARIDENDLAELPHVRL